MRQIKFRLWDKKNKDMLYYDNYIVPKMTLNGVLEEWIGHTSSKPHIPIYDNVSADYEIMQFTGLKDKLGKEIYDGDIVKAVITSNQGAEDIGNGYVDFHSGKCAFQVYLKNGEKSLSCNDEVIGNIYENPELLNN